MNTDTQVETEEEITARMVAEGYHLSWVWGTVWVDGPDGKGQGEEQTLMEVWVK